MSRLLPATLLLMASASALIAAEPPAYVVPVVTAQVKDRIYSTTLALRNDGHEDVSCEAIYAVPNDPKGGTLRATYVVPHGGRPHVEEDVLMEVGAVGTMRLACTAPLVIVARIHTSTDGGRTFDESRTFPALDEAASFNRLRTLTARTDLLVAEVTGKPVTVEVTVKNAAGAVIGRKTYEVPAFAQQIVNVSEVSDDVPTPHVELRVTGGAGALVVGEETRDPALLKMAVRMMRNARRAFNDHQTQQVAAAARAASSVPSISQQLLLCPFKAAPFRDPATGLCFMRHRWYDPNAGTFLTPDPEGYGDSSNLYIFGKGDPVNNHDPTGRHTQVQRRVGGIDFTIYAPTADELAKGQLGMHGTYIHPITGRTESFSWDQHVSEMFLLQARWNPALASSFEAFFGVPPDAIPLSTPRIFWNGLHEHKEDIALSTVLSLTMLAPTPARTTAPRASMRVNMVQPRLTVKRRPSVLVPGGGLAAHEQAGGHTIAKHVGQTRAQLEARLLAERNIASTSTFATPATGEQVVADAIAANQAKIQTWLRGTAGRLRIDYAATSTTGFTLQRGAADVLPVQGARIILVRDTTMPTGYRILTSFPQ